jgi:hypothetical protein
LATHLNKTAPLSDAIIIAVARIVDDAQSETREPSHSDIEFQISQVQLQQGDPKTQGQLVGKAKRVRDLTPVYVPHTIRGFSTVSVVYS